MGTCSSSADNPKNKTYLIQVLDEHEGGINCASLSEDGSVLATGSEDRNARLWSAKTDRCECIGILKGHEDYINCILIEENFVVTGSADKTLRKWDMSTCDCLHVFRGHNSLVNRVICTGDFLFSSSYDRTSRCWDFDTGECIRVFTGHKRGVYPLIFIPGDDEEDENLDEQLEWGGNTDVLITGSADFTARLWSFETGKCVKVFNGHTGAITCMAADPLGKTLFTGGTDNKIYSWDIFKGEKLKSFEGHTAAVVCMTVVGKIMYTGSSDMTARSWVTEFGDCTRVYKGHQHTVSCIRFHKGFSSGDSNVRCYDAKSAALKRQFAGHSLAVNIVQVTDGKLFSGSHDGTLRVWDASGIKDDTAFGRSTEPEPEKEKVSDKQKEFEQNQNNNKADNKIMIDEDDYTSGHRQNGLQSPNDYNENRQQEAPILID